MFKDPAVFHLYDRHVVVPVDWSIQFNANRNNISAISWRAPVEKAPIDITCACKYYRKIA